MTAIAEIFRFLGFALVALTVACLLGTAATFVISHVFWLIRWLGM